MSGIDDAIKANQAYVRGFELSGLDMPPARKLAIVACMDARLTLEPMLGLETGDAHIIRNAGGLVTEDVVRSLVISQQLLGTREVMIVNHTDCGMLTFSDDELSAHMVNTTGKFPVVPAQFGAFRNLEQNVREQVHKLKSHPWVKDISIRGFIYDVKTGQLNEVSAAPLDKAA
jgi:carbonic anhydrase